MAGRVEGEALSAAEDPTAVGTTQQDKARSQVLWMVDQARRAARDGRDRDAGWWSNEAMGALWNLN